LQTITKYLLRCIVLRSGTKRVEATFGPAFRSKSSLANAQMPGCSCGLSAPIGANLQTLLPRLFYSKALKNYHKQKMA